LQHANPQLPHDCCLLALHSCAVVEFAITAEQGASVFTWPNEWRKAIADTRAILAK
jgi:hypothetical protein